MIAVERSTIAAFTPRCRKCELNATLLALSREELKRAGLGLKYRDNVKDQLEEVHRERYMGTRVRVHSEKYFMGEQPTKRRLGKEQKKSFEGEIGMI